MIGNLDNCIIIEYIIIYFTQKLLPRCTYVTNYFAFIEITPRVPETEFIDILHHA